MEATRRWLDILAVILIVTATSCSRSAASYVARGDALVKANQLNDAALTYRSAINKDKNYFDAYDRLSQLEVRRGNLAVTYALLVRANELRPGDEGIEWRLVDAALSVYGSDSRRPKVPYQTIRRLLDQAAARGDSPAKLARAEGLLASIDRRNGEAITFLESAERLSPGLQDVRFHLVRLYIEEKRGPDAEKLALAALKSDPHFLTMYDVLADYYTAMNRTQDVERLLDHEASENPTSADAILKLAGFRIMLKQTAAGEQMLRRLLDNPKDFPDGRVLVGDFYVRLGREDDAVRIFEEAERVDSAHKTTYGKRLANLYWAKGEHKEATAKIESVLTLAKDDEEALRMQASFLLEDGKDLPRVIQTYAALTRKYPNNHILHYQLGKAYQQSGDLGGAWKSYQAAARLDPTFLAVKLSLSEVSAQRGDYQGSLKYLDEIRKIDTGNVHIRFLRAATLRILKRIPEAKEEILSALRMSPDNADCQIERGLIALAENDFANAQSAFQSVYNKTGSDLRAVRGLAQAYTGQRQYAKARTLLETAAARFPGDEGIRQSLAEVMWMSGDTEGALGLYRQILAANPSNANATLQTARLHLERGEVEEGLQILRKATVAKQPDAALILATALHQRGQMDEARATYEQALRMDPNNPLIKNNLAYCYAQGNRNLDEALRLAKSAIDQDKNNPVFADTLAFVYLKTGMPDSSQQVLQELLRRYPENPVYRLHLAMTLVEKGDRAGARSQLQTAMLSKPTASTQSEIKAVMVSLQETP